MKVVQLTPYFSPHRGGLESVAEQFSKYFVKLGFGSLINLTFSVGQTSEISHYETISYRGKVIGYWKDGYQVVILPAFDIVPNFPFPKFRLKQYRRALSYIRKYNPDIIQTHTRFFLSTLIGGLLARSRKTIWVHVEHGSGFVKGLSWFKKMFADTYDYTLGRLCFRRCTAIVAISQANVQFIQKFVSSRKVSVIYNGMELPQNAHISKHDDGIVKVVYAGRLNKLKAIDILLEACNVLFREGDNSFDLDIIGYGEEKKTLEEYVKKHHLTKIIHFLGIKSHDDIIGHILPSKDIVVNPSYQEGLPTLVLEGLLTECVVVATDVGGTSEISDKKDLIIIQAGNVDQLVKAMKNAFDQYKHLRGLSKKVVEEKFDLSKNTEKFYALYKKLLHE